MNTVSMENIISFKGNFAQQNADGTDTKIDALVKKSYPASEVKSTHANQAQASRGKTTDPKIYNLLNGLHGVGKYDIALGSTKDGGYAEVLDNETGNTSIVYVTKKDDALRPILSFSACDISPLGTSTPYADGHIGTALLAAVIALQYEDDVELRGFINSYKNFVIEDPNSPEFDKPTFANAVGKIMCEVSTNLYYVLKNEMTIQANLSQLRQSDLQMIGQKTMTFPFGEVKKIQKAEVRVKGNKGMFDLNPKRILTPDEASRVPVMPESFKWEPWMFTIAQDIRDSRMFAEPISMIMLYGPSGTGKSQAAAAISSLLNRPMVIWTASPDSDEYSLIGSIQPNTSSAPAMADDTFDKLCKEQGIPTFADVSYDFEGSWEKLFGTAADAYSEPHEAYNEIIKRVKWPVANEKDFKFVPSPILTALHFGWGVEIQEVKIIKRSTVLVELNSLFDKDPKMAMLTLPNGETWHRHPEAFAILTTNMNYDGCKNLQQSFLSRIDVIREVENPTEQTIVERAIANTGCKDKKSVKLMAKIVLEMADACEKDDITDGVCGSRELQSWIKKSMLFQLRKDGQCEKLERETLTGAMFSTVIEHCSQNDEDKEHIITEVIAKTFKQTEIEAGKSAYYSGLV